jgi:hypothetical protein
MASINSVASITISSSSRQPTRAGFGLPLVLTYHTVFPEKIRFYSDLPSMEADGFALDSEAYLAAQAIFSQNPSCARIAVGRKNAAVSFTSVLTILSADTGAHIRLKAIDDTGTVNQIDYTVPAASTTTTVATAVELLLEAVPGFATSSSGADITVAATTPSTGFKPKLYDFENCGAHETTADSDYDDELTLVASVDSSWFFIVTDTASPANAAKIAAWALSHDKMYFVATQSNLELDGTGTLGSDLKALTNVNAVVMFHENVHEYAGAAWVGMGAPRDPGSITWANKALLGVTAKELSATAETFLTADNINTYQPIAGLGATRPGVTAGGEWIDVVHGIYALKAAIQEAVWTVLANADKVPFTDAGLDMISGAILGAMKRFEGSQQQPGLLIPGSSKVQMPLAKDISAADKRARRLVGVGFSANFAGAVHFVSLVGRLTY